MGNIREPKSSGLGDQGIIARSAIASPVVPGAAAYKAESFSPKEIVDAYGRLGIDVGDYFHSLKSVDLYRCEKTGYRFFYPLSLAGKADLYERLQLRPGYYRLKYEHRAAIRHVAEGSRVLEVGCGQGLFLASLSQKCSEVVGLEFNDLAVKKANDAGLCVYKEDIMSFALKNKARFDVVCCFQVLEHVPDVKNFIDGMLLALRDKGLLIVGVPNNNPYLYRSDRLHTLNLPPHHIGLWDGNSLANMASVFPFDVVAIEVEPLDDLDYYFEVNFGRQHPRAYGAIRALLSAIRPYRLRLVLDQLISRRIPGRNLLAVYRKYDTI